MAPMNTTAICPLCEAHCGLDVALEHGRLASVRGRPTDLLSRGYLCPKGAALGELQHDPDRVLTPLRRVGDELVEATWEEALTDITARMAALQAEHGRDAVGAYYGNPVGHDYRGVLMGQLFRDALGSRSVFSANSTDALPRLLVSLWLYGSQAVLPVPDLDRCMHLLVLGANPVVSNGSVMSAPGMPRRLKELKARGGRLVVVDPRRTETARLAHAHHFIRPGTDALLLLAMLQHLGAGGRLSAGPLLAQRDVDRVQELVAPFTAEKVAGAVGIDADTISRLATEFADAESACCYGRLGTCVQRFGTLTTWAIDVLNATTGNLDSPGGAMFPHPAAGLQAVAALLGETGTFDRYRTGDLPEFNGELPVASMADLMRSSGPDRLRALVVISGNPALSVPGGRDLEDALAGLDLLVSIDPYRNETSRLAHWILPPSLGLEVDFYPLVFEALSVRNVVRYAPARMVPPEGVRPDGWILRKLALGLLRARGVGGRVTAGALRALLGRGARPVLSLLLAAGPYGLRRGLGAVTLKRLEAAPDGLDMGPLQPRLAKILRTGGTIELVPDAIGADIDRLAETLRAPADSGALQLIGRRSARSNNSWMHNAPSLMKGRTRCTLQMHPDDAAARGLEAGDLVRVTAGEDGVELPVQLSTTMMRGVVSMPHGYGHHRVGAKLSVAGAHPGVSMNDVLGAGAVDPLSGTSVLSGVPVRVEAVEARLARTG